MAVRDLPPPYSIEIEMIATGTGSGSRSGAPSVPSPGLAPTPPPIKRAGSGWWLQVVSLVKYLAQSEVHTYAFSVAAFAILALFPFIVMTWTVERSLFHSPYMQTALVDMLRYFLPAHQNFVVRNMALLTHPRGKTQIISTITLLISSTGVFLPLEVALNRVWNAPKNRSYLGNQLISLSLAFCVGVLALGSIALTASQSRLLAVVFFGHTSNVVFSFIMQMALRFNTAILSIIIFFLVYWILPNRKLPIMAVLPTAIVAGLLWEVAKEIYVLVLPRLNLWDEYGPFYVSVGLIIWGYVTGLILLSGAQFSATRQTLKLARAAERAAATAEKAAAASKAIH